MKPTTDAPRILQDMSARRILRVILLAFVITFLCARVLVLLIMTREIPDLYLHLGGTHIHHLNFGIFILAAIPPFLMVRGSSGSVNTCIAILYGIGLALTFDEFGMWIHLGGGYWQRASFDALTVITALLLLAAYSPTPRRWTPAVLAFTFGLLTLGSVFSWYLYLSLSQIENRMLPELENIEQRGPT